MTGCNDCRSSARCMDCMERDGLTLSLDAKLERALDDIEAGRATQHDTDDDFLDSLK